MIDLVVVLHAHLPYVLGHGRWPHGSDWLMEAVVDSYLPFLDMDDALGRQGVAAPVTLGVTPVLAAQLASPDFAAELRDFLAQRLATCDEAERELSGRGEETLVGVVRFWRALYLERARSIEARGGDIIGALRSLEAAGRIELTSSAATHAFLPLLARDESIRLQLLAGLAEHGRLFGRTPAGSKALLITIDMINP